MMRNRLSALVVLVAACSRPAEPTPVTAPVATVATVAPAPSPSPAPAPASASSPPPSPSLSPPPSSFADAYAKVCPELANVTSDPDAGAPGRPPTATDLMVSAKMKTVKKDFVASIAVPAKRIDREVFRMGTEGDPFQCCSRATADGLDVRCMFSGIDVIDGRAHASVEGDAVVIRWCKADLSTGDLLDRGDARVLTGGAHAWFGASTPACAPKLPQ